MWFLFFVGPVIDTISLVLNLTLTMTNLQGKERGRVSQPSQVRRTPSTLSVKGGGEGGGAGGQAPRWSKRSGGPGLPAGVGAGVAAAPSVARAGWTGTQAGEWLHLLPDIV